MQNPCSQSALLTPQQCATSIAGNNDSEVGEDVTLPPSPAGENAKTGGGAAFDIVTDCNALSLAPPNPSTSVVSAINHSVRGEEEGRLHTSGHIHVHRLYVVGSAPTWKTNWGEISPVWISLTNFPTELSCRES